MDILKNYDIMQAPQKKMPHTEVSPIYTDEISFEKSIFDVNQKSILQGIIFLEILGKPKSKRTGR